MDIITKDILTGLNYGILKIGNAELKCAVLEDGTRIINKSTVFKAFGRTKRGRKKGEIRVPDMPFLPSFIDSKNLQPILQNNSELLDILENPIQYKASNGRISTGYNAQIIPLICDVYLEARKQGIILKSQESLATISEMLVRSLSKIGIVALIDEVTGYQEYREKEELEKLLNLYISRELINWQITFPNEFYDQIYRLKKWDKTTSLNKRPQVIGHYCNKYVYEMLGSEVLNKLKEKNPRINRYRKYQHHRYLTRDVGYQNLKHQIDRVLMLMRISSDWKEFEINFNIAFNVNNSC